MVFHLPKAIAAEQHKKPQRFLVLLAFCLFTAVNGYSWLMFEPIEKTLLAQYAPYFSSSQVALLGSWQPVAYLLLFLPMTRWLLTPNGLTFSLRRCVTIELIAASIKVFSTTTLARSSIVGCVCLHLGQILSAVTSPVAIGVPSQLSSEWFPAHSRTRATAAAVLSNNVGNACVYALVPTLAMLAGNDITYVVWVELLAAICSAVATFFAFPIYSADVLEEAAEGPSPQLSPQLVGHTTQNFKRINSMSMLENLSFFTAVGQAELPKSYGFWEQTKMLFMTRSSLIVLLTYMWSSGAFVAWTALFDHLLVAMHLHFSDAFIGMLSFSSTVCYVLGGLISSYLCDKYFSRKMKLMIWVCCIGNSLVTYLYSESLPKSAPDTVPVCNKTTLAALHHFKAGHGYKPDFVQHHFQCYLPVSPAAHRHQQRQQPKRQHKQWQRQQRLHAEASASVLPTSPVLSSDDVVTNEKAISHEAWYSSIGNGVIGQDAKTTRHLLLVLSGLGGLFNGASAPIFYEFLAELTFPKVHEAVSGNFLSFLENGGALIMFQVVDRIVPREHVNQTFTLGMVIFSIAFFFVKEQYNRRDYEEEQVNIELEMNRDRELFGSSADDNESTTKLFQGFSFNYGGCDDRVGPANMATFGGGSLLSGTGFFGGGSIVTNRGGLAGPNSENISNKFPFTEQDALNLSGSGRVEPTHEEGLQM